MKRNTIRKQMLANLRRKSPTQPTTAHTSAHTTAQKARSITLYA